MRIGASDMTSSFSAPVLEQFPPAVSQHQVNVSNAPAPGAIEPDRGEVISAWITRPLKEGGKEGDPANSGDAVSQRVFIARQRFST